MFNRTINTGIFAAAHIISTGNSNMTGNYSLSVCDTTADFQAGDSGPNFNVLNQTGYSQRTCTSATGSSCIPATGGPALDACFPKAAGL